LRELNGIEALYAPVVEHAYRPHSHDRRGRAR
jgi:hypothetical protein